MENKVKVWLARDENGAAYIYEDKPSKDTIYGEWLSNSHGIFKKMKFFIAETRILNIFES